MAGTDPGALPTGLSASRAGFRGIGDPYQAYQSKRRQEALLRQKAARLQSANRARCIAFETPDSQDGAGEEEQAGSEDAEMQGSVGQNHVDAGGADTRARTRRAQSRQQQSAGKAYAQELMQPEWLTDVPPDLPTSWLVMARPEGVRCLLVTSRGRTVSWLRNGSRLHTFLSPLPGGSPRTAAAASAGGGGASALYGGGSAAASTSDYCILDCVYYKPTNTYYVQDLLCWRGYALYDCTAEFRTFWLQTKFAEEGLAVEDTAAPNQQTGAVPGQQQVASSDPHMQQQSGSGSAGQTQGHGQASTPIDASMGDDGDGAAEGDGEEGGDQGGMEVEGPGGGRGSGAGRRRRGRGGGVGGRGRHGRGGRSGSAQAESLDATTHRIVPLPVHPCTLEGFAAAYGPALPLHQRAPASGTLAAAAGGGTAATAAQLTGAGAVPASDATSSSCPFVRDGVYLLHRQGHYCPGPAPTPLALLWKDLGCSRYLLDTDTQGAPLQHQQALLSLRADGTVATCDEPPVVLGRLPPAFVQSLNTAGGAAGRRAGPEAAAAAAQGEGGAAAAGGAAGACGAEGGTGSRLQGGKLLRFSIGQGGIMFHEGRPCGADLRYEGVVHSARRGRADSFSKLLFQRMAREGSPSIGLPALLHAIEDGGNGAGEGQVEGSGPQDVAMG